MLKRTELPAFAAFNPVAVFQPLQFGAALSLPPVPVLPETLLLLEIEAQERCVDLRRVSQIVLSDLGATVQILRLAGRELSDPTGPTRIEDCISELGICPCLDAMSAQATTLDYRYSAIAQLWSHSRDIAQHSKLVAEGMPDVNPDQAYLAGLLHAVGSLPAALGWPESVLDESRSDTLGLLNQLSMPRFVSKFFSEMHSDERRISWSEIVRMAHRQSAQSSIHCVVKPEIYPLIYADVAGALS